MAENNSEQVYPEIDLRPYRQKKPVLDFLCPLCGAERQFSRSYKMTGKNYFQMLIVSIVMLLVFYPFMAMKGLIFFPVCFAVFEMWARVSFRKDIPCPHCGFDASWYKRDVVKARRIVQDFWERKKVNKNKTVTATDELTEDLGAAEEIEEN